MDKILENEIYVAKRMLEAAKCRFSEPNCDLAETRQLCATLKHEYDLLRDRRARYRRELGA